MPFINSVRGTFGPSGRFGSSLGSVVASGGTITTYSTYKVHTFNNSGTFTLSSVPAGATFDILMVAGGGGGGTGNGNNSAHPAGGAGGLIYRTGQSLTAGSYPVVVGVGGAGGVQGTPGATYAGTGTNTTFNGLIALGGGGGVVGLYNTLDGQAGGSGSGAQHADNGKLVGGAGLQPGSASGGFGNKGGDGPLSNTGGPCWVGGGGGGAGAAGANGTPNIGGEGGIGRQYDISGISRYYAGGGGGGTTQTNSNTQCLYNPPGGLGGGGIGGGHFGPGDTGKHGGDAFGNLGGGGGGATSGTDKFLSGTPGLRGGNGSRGTVIIRYNDSTSLSAPQNVPGLKVWLDASSSSNFTFSGSNITSWIDKSGNGYSASAFGTVTHVANQQNSLPVVRFDGINGYMNNTSLPFEDQRTVFFVRKLGNGKSNHAVFGFSTRFGTEAWNGVYRWDTPSYGFNTYGGDSYGVGTFSSTSFAVDTFDFKSAVGTPSANSWSLRINGINQSLSQLRGTSRNNQQYADGYWIAVGPNSAEHGPIDVAELIIFDTVLSDSQKQVIEQYLISKWGIS
jgi:hypothetical protein